jgi:hypothetical protein
VHLNDADSKVLAYQYLQTLPQLAQAQGNTFWVIPSEVTTALKMLSGAFSSEGVSPPLVPQARSGELTGAAAALTADGAGQPAPGANGEQTRAEQAAAAEAARTKEEVAEVEQEVAAVQRQIAESERG